MPVTAAPAAAAAAVAANAVDAAAAAATIPDARLPSVGERSDAGVGAGGARRVGGVAAPVRHLHRVHSATRFVKRGSPYSGAHGLTMADVRSPHAALRVRVALTPRTSHGIGRPPLYNCRKREKQNEPLWVNLANTVVAPEENAIGSPPKSASSTSRPPAPGKSPPRAQAVSSGAPSAPPPQDAGLELSDPPKEMRQPGDEPMAA